ncbi:cupin domain-containing protein [Pontibacter chitinilyticus]|uniref:cupin domain-containing protein n=1 Tax=Pontibacter chitinilyticus TaxID=2674989 RepID=UPI00321BBD85
MARTTKGVKVNAAGSRNGVSLEMKGVTRNTLDLKVSPEDTGGELAIFEQTGHTPHGGPPLHIHPFQDEIFYVLQGEYLFQVGDEQYELKTGDTIFLPRQVPHAFIQLSDEGKVLVIYQPAGKMEAFFRKTAAWTSPPSAEEIARTFAENDMHVVGPPLRLN